jgi:hypothetical protein
MTAAEPMGRGAARAGGEFGRGMRTAAESQLAGAQSGWNLLRRLLGAQSGGPAPSRSTERGLGGRVFVDEDY